MCNFFASVWDAYRLSVHSFKLHMCEAFVEWSRTDCDGRSKHARVRRDPTLFRGDLLPGHWPEAAIHFPFFSRHQALCPLYSESIGGMFRLVPFKLSLCLTTTYKNRLTNWCPALSALLNSCQRGICDFRLLAQRPTRNVRGRNIRLSMILVLSSAITLLMQDSCPTSDKNACLRAGNQLAPGDFTQAYCPRKL